MVGHALQHVDKRLEEVSKLLAGGVRSHQYWNSKVRGGDANAINNNNDDYDDNGNDDDNVVNAGCNIILADTNNNNRSLHPKSFSDWH